MKRILPLLLFTIAFWQTALAQLPPGACAPPITLASTCSESCVLCGIDGFTNTNSSTDLGMAPPGFCAPQLHNTQWVGFVAGSTSISMQIDVFDCQINGDGLQIGIYGTQNCEDFQLVSECYPSIPENTFAQFNMSGLQVGGIYFVVIDGSNGDICDFTIDITSGSGNAPPIVGNTIIQGQGPFCPGGTFPFNAFGVQGASIYTWTLNGNIISYEQLAAVTIPASGNNFQLCVTPSNPCFTGNQVCQTFPITPLPLNNLGTVKICQGESYSYGGMTFSQTGLYNFNAVVGNGCLQPTRLNLIVQQPQFTDLGVQEICADENFLVGGQPAFPGFNTFNLNTVGGGCDSTVTVFLIVHPITGTLVDEDLCQGESIVVRDNFGHQYTFNQTGTYEVTLTSSEGCDSFVFVNLQVFAPPPPVSLVRTICQGEFFLLGNQALTQPGIYNAQLETAAGCDSVVTLTLSVSNPMSNLNVTLCAGQSISVGNSTYNATGMYTKVLQDASSLGCDSTVHLNLTVLPANITTINATICQGESYTIGTTPYTTSGSFQQIFDAANNCDSTVRLNLTVLPVPVTNLDQTLCYGESYTVGSSTYTASGIYHDTLTAFTGCDSIINLDLTILPQIVTNLQEEICENESFSMGGNPYNTNGIFRDTLTALNGCDSIVVLDLTVNDVPETFLTGTICQGASYTVGNTDYTSSGNFTTTLTTVLGCDSIVHLNLSVIPPTEYPVSAAICTGQTYFVGPSGYTSSGTYRDTLSNSIGCDSIVVLSLIVADILETTLDIELCEGESFTVGNSTFNQTGNYDEFFTTSTGCDSVVHLNLTVFDEPETNLTISICEGESYSVGASTYSATGNYQNILTAFTGCDSVVKLNLTVLDVPETFLVESICDGESYQVGPSSYNTAGTYQDVLVAANGCDSIVNLNLTILDVPETFLDENICDGESYAVGTSSYTASGTYQDVLVAANGCDSIVNLTLTVLDVPETYLTELICDGESYALGGNSYTTSGQYQATFTAANGCDSLVFLDLTVAPIEQTNIVVSICTGSSYEVGNSSYNATGTYQDILTSTVTGCDSIVNLNLTVTSFYQINLNEEICEGESFTVGSSVYTASGMYQNQFLAQDGCDSFVVLNLTVFPVPVTNLTPTICDGESFTVGNSTYTTTGVYQNVLTTVNGCDSIVNLNLTVSPVFLTTLTEEICDGDSFGVGSSSYTASGVYQDVLTAANGCDSTVTLNLTVHPIPVTDLSPTVCNGETYTVGTTTFNATGVYQQVLTSTVTGCDSIVNLNLTVRPLIQTSLVREICNGESFQVGSSSYTTSGTYQDVLTSTTGCDSIVNLNLTVNPVYAVTLNEIICDDESYQVGNSNYSSTGTFITMLSSAEGCDSIVTLNLTVHPCQLSLNISDTDALCNGSTNGSISFAMTVGTPPYTYAWQQLPTGLSGSGNIAGNNINTLISNLGAGNYRITITDSYNIQTIVNQQVQQPNVLTAAVAPSNFNGFGVPCPDSENGTLTGSANGGTPPYSYLWTGNITGAVADNLAAGTYNLTVTDQHGCQAQATGQLTSPESIKASIETTDPACYGDAEGFISVSDVIGGVGPYQYALDNGPYTSAPILSNLGVGVYTIQIKDANGCIFEEDVTINQPEELIVDLGEDIRIFLGDSVRLLAQTSYPVDSFIWKADPTLSCTNCFDPTASPMSGNSYSVTVFDDNGCRASDQILVIVEKKRQIYIPNGFSPNGDGQNDVFMIFGGQDVREIKKFMLFNRWGETMFELFNFQPNDPSYGWDGTHRGRAMNTGVYVYFAEVEFIDGEVIIYKGDVVLIK